MGGLGPQGQLRAAGGERFRLVCWDGIAPLHRTVAVLADLTPKDAEERAGTPRYLRQLVMPEQADELLAERPCRLLAGDIALHAQQAPFGDLPRADLVHDRPLSA